MPLTSKGNAIEAALTKEYGKEKGEQVLYAGQNKGTFTGIDKAVVGRVDGKVIGNFNQMTGAYVSGGKKE